MAFGQAVELLQSMGNRVQAFGPLGFHATSEGRVGSGPLPVVFANLPTITEVSRAAFFAGRALAPGEATSTQRDPERFAAHAGLRARCAPGDVPRLLLRAESHTQAGAASAEALTLVRDPSRRVVGIVVNAIDAALKRDPQHGAKWTVESILSLGDLLDAAREAGRAILLSSDHGHVPSDLLRKVGAPGREGGARWRVADAGSEATPEERVFRGPGVWAPRGHDAAVLLVGDRGRYGAAPNAGEHGGARLAEVVTPCLLIGSASLGDEAPRAERVSRAYVPDWWLLSVRAARRADEARDEAGASKRPARKKKQAPESQLALGGFIEPAPEPAPKATSPRPAEDLEAHPLARSGLFCSLAPSKTQQAELIKAVRFLEGRNGAATAEDFAAAMGELAFRVRGLVSNLQAVLNVDGYQVLWFDEAGQQVRLERDRLAQQFEVTP
jgi:hypothetical protein